MSQSEKELKEIQRLKDEIISAEGKGDWFLASICTRNLIPLLKGKDNQEDLNFFKKKLVELSKKAAEYNFKKFEFAQTIKKEEIEKFISFFTNSKNSNDLLIRIGKYPTFKISIESVRKMPVSAASQFCSVVCIDDEGHAIKGSTDNERFIYMRNYQIAQSVAGVFLDLLFQKLISDEMIDADGLTSFFKKKRVLDENLLQTLEVGIARYFAGDYVSALHIFVPQFEYLFTHFSKALGFNSVTLGRPEKGSKEVFTGNQYVTSQILRKGGDKSLKSFWGDDFCEQVNFVFYDPMGLNLRNIVAHGNIKFDKCDFYHATLVLFFFITLFARLDHKDPTAS